MSESSQTVILAIKNRNPAVCHLFGLFGGLLCSKANMECNLAQGLSKSGNSADQNSSHVNSSETDDAFLCSVCLEPVKDRDPVVTQCGHLYCWPCLYRWLNTNHTTCPVCKAGVTQENVIPIFIKGAVEDPRTRNNSSSTDEQIPNRPLGHRPEPQTNLLPGGSNTNQNLGGGPLSPGVGYFPSLFGLLFQRFAVSNPPTEADALEAAQTLYLQRIIQFLITLVVVCLIFF